MRKRKPPWSKVATLPCYYCGHPTATAYAVSEPNEFTESGYPYQTVRRALCCVCSRGYDATRIRKEGYDDGMVWR